MKFTSKAALNEAREELKLALKKHTEDKISTNDLVAILTTFGVNSSLNILRMIREILKEADKDFNLHEFDNLFHKLYLECFFESRYKSIDKTKTVNISGLNINLNPRDVN